MPLWPEAAAVQQRLYHSLHCTPCRPACSAHCPRSGCHAQLSLHLLLLQITRANSKREFVTACLVEPRQVMTKSQSWLLRPRAPPPTLTTVHPSPSAVRSAVCTAASISAIISSAMSSSSSSCLQQYRGGAVSIASTRAPPESHHGVRAARVVASIPPGCMAYVLLPRQESHHRCMREKCASRLMVELLKCPPNAPSGWQAASRSSNDLHQEREVIHCVKQIRDVVMSNYLPPSSTRKDQP